jgi:chromosome segregation ATPase
MNPLHDQLATIERELAALDFDAAHERVRQAEAAVAAVHVGATYHAADDVEVQARGALKQARTALTALDSRAAELRREAAGIAKLLSAGERVEQAQAAVQHAQKTAAVSAAALAEAEATCARLASAVEAEKRAAAAAVEASAAAMLEAARTGADADTVAVRPDKLAPLRAALAGAEGERDTAKTRHAADLAAVTAAQRRVCEAEADASQGEYEAAEAAFVGLAAQHVAALTRAGRQAPAFMALHGKVLAAAQALEVSP